VRSRRDCSLGVSRCKGVGCIQFSLHGSDLVCGYGNELQKLLTGTQWRITIVYDVAASNLHIILAVCPFLVGFFFWPDQKNTPFLGGWPLKSVIGNCLQDVL